MSGYCWFVLEAWFVLEGGIWPKGGPYDAHNSESNFSRLIIRFIVGFVLGKGINYFKFNGLGCKSGYLCY